jgi:CheY-like chemotaxis protein
MVQMADILVVDNVRDVADSLAELLTLFGHDVRVAYGGAHALCEIELNPPDVALIDLDMPVLDGFRLARRIRASRGSRIRLVAHTARPRASVAAKASAAGFDSFASKSARPLELALALRGRRGQPDLRVADRDRRAYRRSNRTSRRSAD